MEGVGPCQVRKSAIINTIIQKKDTSIVMTMLEMSFSDSWENTDQ